MVTETIRIICDVVFQSLPSEIEVKYKIAECYTILKLDKDAIAVLDGIPSRQRTPKVGCSSHSYCNKHFIYALCAFSIIQVLYLFTQKGFTMNQGLQIINFIKSANVLV